MHHVILGAGPCGVTAAETIRKHSPDARITLVTSEPEPPYSRMAIPYLLVGNITEEGTLLRHASSHFDELGIDIRHKTAAGLDTGAKYVTFTDGSAIAYDRLLIATGASPVRPPIEGLDLPGVNTCWTLEDARQIISGTSAGDPVVLVGAGFIGCIILEALVEKGLELTVVEMGDRMVPRMLDETAGNMLKRWCEHKGVRVLTSTTVERITASGTTGRTAAAQTGFFTRMFGVRQGEPSTREASPADGLLVHLSSGDVLPARLVVVATGVRANIGFLQGSGVEVEDGVMVDDHLRTSAPDVWASGDAAQGRDLSTGSFDVLAIQPVAVEHGYIAGLNMAGIPAPHRGSLSMNVLDTMGLISCSFGAWMGKEGGERGQLLDESTWRYIRLEFLEDRLVGGQAIGLTEHVGMIRGLIQTGLRLGSWKDKLIRSPERLAEAYVATAQGIS